MPLTTLYSTATLTDDPDVVMQCWREAILHLMLRILSIWMLVSIGPHALMAITQGRIDWVMVCYY